MRATRVTATAVRFTLDWYFYGKICLLTPLVHFTERNSRHGKDFVEPCTTRPSVSLLMIESSLSFAYYIRVLDYYKDQKVLYRISISNSIKRQPCIPEASALDRVRLLLNQG